MSGGFLKADDVKTGDIVKFISEGKYVDKEFEGKKKQGFNIEIRFDDDEETTASLNATSFNNMIDAYGDDTVSWVGKEARIEKVTQNVQGKFKDVIFFTHPSKDVRGQLINQ